MPPKAPPTTTKKETTKKASTPAQATTSKPVKKTCPEDEILDTTTNRCVSLTGKRGTEVVAKHVSEHVSRKPLLKSCHIVLPYLKINTAARVSFVNPKTQDELMMKYVKKDKQYKLIKFPKGEAKKKETLGSFTSPEHMVYFITSKRLISSSSELLMSTSKEGVAITL